MSSGKTYFYHFEFKEVLLRILTGRCTCRVTSASKFFFWARDTNLSVWVLQAYLSVGLFTYPCPLIQFMIGLLPEGGANLRTLLGGQTHPLARGLNS